MSGADTTYRDWLRSGKEDRLNIANNLDAESIPWTTVCFHSQQAAEKYLKALLVFHRRVPPRIHDLVALLTQCVELDAELA